MPSTVFPTLRYRNAAKMINWLCDVMGFQCQLVVNDEDGNIVHAQLTLGTGMIMIGSERDDEFSMLQKIPAVLGGTTQSAYVVVKDADAVYARARKADADIVVEIKDEDYGGRGFSVRDPEYHLWNVGTYNPWKDMGGD